VRYVPVAEHTTVDMALAWRASDTSPALGRVLEALEANGFVPPRTDHPVPDDTPAVLR
jgi:hypothetical protein